ncbi:hypothetical protein DFQ05_2669 [Winogradskyella wandonensis]|uniref:Deoxyribose-phosphate aldolase n=1 Tax=Winogradskyella wandonensis TaxID=1442586 RepID=A0A4R1KIK8_9FLAO|nr:DUF6503 family protein [Winogradskyella wandonensis]TCK64686.1 hypothetical protein DFQ05_2669 [Winogradskyella wandonensis]
MKYLQILLILLLFYNCKNENSKAEAESLTANEIIDKSIEVAGGEKFDSSTIKFVFRDHRYTAIRTEGKFRYTRFKVDDNKDSILDILKNEGFRRYINMQQVKVADSMIAKYTASVNSVHYFSVLPHGLNDQAVNKKLIGEEQIKGVDYYRIEVTFDKEGGGEDYEDVFIYWINKATFKPDYLAYSYNEDDGKGMRFREAFNERYVNGLRFADYNNYKSDNPEIKLQDLAKAFDSNKLKLLSKIELENVEVDLIDL